MTKGATFALALLALLILLHNVNSIMTDVNGLPTIDNSHQVQFYFLETSFPFNVPESISGSVGNGFKEYSTLVAGIGIWDTTSNKKFSIQFVSNSYVGALFPILNHNNGGITWNNTGSIVVTDPLDESSWISSRHIVTTDGGPYSRLVQYLQESDNSVFDIYQPINIVYPSSTMIANYTADDNSFIFQLNSANEGNEVVEATNSYTFAKYVVDELHSIGCKVDSFLPIYTSSFSYMTDSDEVEILDYMNNITAKNEVFDWFSSLESCYKNVFANAVASSTESLAFESISICYNISSYAYVYNSESSVYKVHLYNTSIIPVPSVYRYIYDLPKDLSNEQVPLDGADIFVLICFFALIAAGAYYFFNFVTAASGTKAKIMLGGDELVNKIVHIDHESSEYYSKPTGGALSFLHHGSDKGSKSTIN
jgi:hypothetical protein